MKGGGDDAGHDGRRDGLGAWAFPASSSLPQCCSRRQPSSNMFSSDEADHPLNPGRGWKISLKRVVDIDQRLSKAKRKLEIPRHALDPFQPKRANAASNFPIRALASASRSWFSSITSSGARATKSALASLASSLPTSPVNFPISFAKRFFSV
jgi:hypothetical protein